MMQPSLEDGHHVGMAIEAEDDDWYGKQRLHVQRVTSRSEGKLLIRHSFRMHTPDIVSDLEIELYEAGAVPSFLPIRDDLHKRSEHGAICCAAFSTYLAETELHTQCPLA